MKTEGSKGMKKRKQISRKIQRLPGVLRAEDYLSVREAARFMGVSTRSVYGYIETGKLPGVRIGASIAVSAKAVREYRRSVVGRPRTRTPIWHVPVTLNLQYLTTIKVCVREGQGENLEQKLTEIRLNRQHLLPGTVARYVVRNCAEPDNIQIVLVWRKVVMPPDEERQAAISALCADLGDVLDWDTASCCEGQVLMNA